MIRNECFLFVFKYLDFDKGFGMVIKEIIDERIIVILIESIFYRVSYGRFFSNIGGGGWCVSF